MARTSISIATLYGTVDPALVVSVPTLADPTNDHQWVFRPGDMLIAHNHGAGPHNVTLKAIENSHNRKTDSSHAVAAGEIYVFGPLQADGWLQTDGNVWVDTDGTAGEVRFAVIRGAK